MERATRYVPCRMRYRSLYPASFSLPVGRGLPAKAPMRRTSRWRSRFRATASSSLAADCLMRRPCLAATPEPGDELVEGNARIVGAVCERCKIFGVLGKTDSHGIVHHVGDTPIRRRRCKGMFGMMTRPTRPRIPVAATGSGRSVAADLVAGVRARVAELIREAARTTRRRSRCVRRSLKSSVDSVSRNLTAPRTRRNCRRKTGELREGGPKRVPGLRPILGAMTNCAANTASQPCRPSAKLGKPQIDGLYRAVLHGPAQQKSGMKTSTHPNVADQVVSTAPVLRPMGAVPGGNAARAGHPPIQPAEVPWT